MGADECEITGDGFKHTNDLKSSAYLTKEKYCFHQNAVLILLIAFEIQ